MGNADQEPTLAGARVHQDEQTLPGNNIYEGNQLHLVTWWPERNCAFQSWLGTLFLEAGESKRRYKIPEKAADDELILRRISLCSILEIHANVKEVEIN